MSGNTGARTRVSGTTTTLSASDMGAYAREQLDRERAVDGSDREGEYDEYDEGRNDGGVSILIRGRPIPNNNRRNERNARLQGLLDEFESDFVGEEEEGERGGPYGNPLPSSGRSSSGYGGGGEASNAAARTPQQSAAARKLLQTLKLRNDPIYQFLQEMGTITRTNTEELVTDQPEQDMLEKEVPALKVYHIDTQSAAETLAKLGLRRSNKEERGGAPSSSSSTDPRVPRGGQEEDDDEGEDEARVPRPSSGWSKASIAPEKNEVTKAARIRLMGKAEDDKKRKNDKPYETMKEFLEAQNNPRGVSKKAKTGQEEEEGVVNLALIDSITLGTINNVANMVFRAMRVEALGLNPEVLIRSSPTRINFARLCGYFSNVSTLNSGRIHQRSDTPLFSNMTAFKASLVEFVKTFEYVRGRKVFALKKRKK